MRNQFSLDQVLLKATDKRMEREAERERDTERDGLERERERERRQRQKKKAYWYISAWSSCMNLDNWSESEEDERNQYIRFEREEKERDNNGIP